MNEQNDTLHGEPRCCLGSPSNSFDVLSIYGMFPFDNVLFVKHYEKPEFLHWLWIARRQLPQEDNLGGTIPFPKNSLIGDVSSQLDTGRTVIWGICIGSRPSQREIPFVNVSLHFSSSSRRLNDISFLFCFLFWWRTIRELFHIQFLFTKSVAFFAKAKWSLIGLYCMYGCCYYSERKITFFLLSILQCSKIQMHQVGRKRDITNPQTFRSTS